VNDELSTSMQHCIGQVQSLCYLLNEPATIVTIQAGAQTITARASGQIALDLRALPRGAIICATLHDAPSDNLEIIAFSVISDDGMSTSLRSNPRLP
jgi:hypothetical protein